MRRSGYLLALLAAASGAMLAPSVTERATLPTPGGQVENQKQGPQTPAPAPSAVRTTSARPAFFPMRHLPLVRLNEAIWIGRMRDTAGRPMGSRVRTRRGGMRR